MAVLYAICIWVHPRIGCIPPTPPSASVAEKSSATAEASHSGARAQCLRTSSLTLDQPRNLAGMGPDIIRGQGVSRKSCAQIRNLQLYRGEKRVARKHARKVQSIHITPMHRTRITIFDPHSNSGSTLVQAKSTIHVCTPV